MLSRENVALLQTAPGQFVYLCAPIDATGHPLLPLDAMVRAQFRQTYGSRTDALPVVVISDGATVIRHRLSRLFTPGVAIILDWYHLCEKLRQLMSMISLNREQKRLHLELMLSDLWHGRVESVKSVFANASQSQKSREIAGVVGLSRETSA